MVPPHFPMVKIIGQNHIASSVASSFSIQSKSYSTLGSQSWLWQGGILGFLGFPGGVMLWSQTVAPCTSASPQPFASFAVGQFTSIDPVCGFLCRAQSVVFMFSRVVVASHIHPVSSIRRFPKLGLPHGSPSHHPFLDWIFHCKPTSYWGIPMAMETPMAGSQWSTQSRLWPGRLVRKSIFRVHRKVRLFRWVK